MRRTKGPRVLVAHHDIAVREVLGPMLRQGGCLVRVVESSVDAVAQAPHFRPDTLIIEPIMPQLDGLKAAKQIAQETNCRVLFLESPLASPEERERFLTSLREGIPNCDLLLLPSKSESILETVMGRRIASKNRKNFATA